jgi:hypothetical protein
MPPDKKRITPGEQVAIDYFHFKGYTDIVHEPDGNIPPDLLINGSIAVEVRRLNQFKIINGIKHPLEDLEFNLMPRVRKMIKTYDSKPSQMTSYVSVGFKRPLAVNKLLLEEIKKVFNHHLHSLDQQLNYLIGDNLEIRFRPTTKFYNKPFVWASQYDRDGGGSVVANILDSLAIIIKDKEEKILPYKSRYSTWWLAVNDKIGYGIDENDLSQLASVFNIETFFERIIFISPFDATHGMELIVPRNQVQ